MAMLQFMSKIQAQFAAASGLENIAGMLADIIKQITGFQRVLVYHFDHVVDSRVVAESADSEALKRLPPDIDHTLFYTLNQDKDAYKGRRMQAIYDRELPNSRLVSKTGDVSSLLLELPNSFLRTTSTMHLRYLRDITVRSSMTVTIDSPGDLWGLIICFSYDPSAMRTSFPNRKVCRLVADVASRNLIRLSRESSIKAWTRIDRVFKERVDAGLSPAVSKDLLRLFHADFGLLALGEHTTTLGQLIRPQESLFILEYFRVRKPVSVLATTNIERDFPDINYPEGLKGIAGVLLVPFANGVNALFAFFRRPQSYSVHKVEKLARKSLHRSFSAPMKIHIAQDVPVNPSFRKCDRWTEEELATAIVLRLVSENFVRPGKKDEVSRLTRLLLDNTAHEIRTALNAVINFLEVALDEGQFDAGTKNTLNRSRSASESLVVTISSLIDRCVTATP